MEELLRRVNFVNMLPSSAGVRLEEGREADVVENFVPVQRINQVTHRLVCRAFGMFLVRQNHRGRNGHAEFGGQRVVKKFVVGGPPEWIVDDDCSAECGVLEISAIEGDVLRDAVDDDAIAAGFGHLHAAELDELGGHALDLHVVDLFHQRWRKSIFHAEHDADFFHGCLTLYEKYFTAILCHRGQSCLELSPQTSSQ